VWRWAGKKCGLEHVGRAHDDIDHDDVHFDGPGFDDDDQRSGASDGMDRH